MRLKKNRYMATRSLRGELEKESGERLSGKRWRNARKAHQRAVRAAHAAKAKARAR